jgi:hypothetical protein
MEAIVGLPGGRNKAGLTGRLQSFYRACLCIDLEDAGIPIQREVVLPAVWRGQTIPMGFRADIVVAGAVIVEVKGVAALLPAHEAQIRTYLRMSGIRIGLLMNFHAARLKDGLRRFVV